MAKSSLLLSLVLALGFILNCEAVTFAVGDTVGWDVSADLQSWLANRIFNVGDVLLFQYSTYHTVNEVDKLGYDECNTSTAILTGSGGNTSVPLTTSGDKYFVSGNRLYCYGGMKIKVNVKGNSTEAGPAGSPQQAQPDSPPGDTDVDDLPPFVINGGFAIGNGRGLGYEAWICTVGVLLWSINVGVGL